MPQKVAIAIKHQAQAEMPAGGHLRRLPVDDLPGAVDRWQA
jgi:hypothetical protein